MLKAIIVEAKIHWGFSVKRPIQSAAQESLLYPPPSTLIGALARGYANLKGLGERVRVGEIVYSPIVKVIDRVYYATIAIHGPIVTHQDMNRNITGVYMRSEHRRDPKNWFGVQAMGKTLSINSECTIVYILGSLDRDLVLSAWSIPCLGSKESLISVNSVDCVDVEVLRDSGPYETVFYVKEGTCLIPPTESVHVLEFWDYRSLDTYKLWDYRRGLRYKPKVKFERYYAPYKPFKDAITVASVTDSGLAVRIGEYTAVIPRP